MKPENQKPAFQSREKHKKASGPALALAAVCAGLLVRLAFAPVGFVPGAALGLGLFFLVLAKTRRPVLLGLLFHAAWGMSLSWFLWEAVLGHFAMPPALGAALFVLMTGIAPSLFFLPAALLAHGPARRARATPGPGNFFQACLIFAGLCTLSFWARTSFSPEGGYGDIASAFAGYPAWLAITPHAGGEALSFAMAFSGAALACAALAFRASRKKLALAALALAASLPAALYGVGLLQSSHRHEVAPGVVAVAVVHPGISQEARWDEGSFEQKLSLYEKLSRAAFASAPEGAPRILVWPETAMNRPLAGSSGTLPRLRALAAETRAWILTGAVAFEGSGMERRHYNAAHLISPEGEISGTYYKRRLLPFAERPVAGIRAGQEGRPLYSAGDKPGVLTLSPGPEVGLGTLICYESGSHRLAVETVTRGADLLVNLSNDAWFGHTSESAQQAALLSLRCAETHRPGVRATGYGEAALIDCMGKFLSRSPIAGACLLEGLLHAPHNVRTFSARFPDWFVLAAALLAAALLLAQAFPPAGD